MSICRAVGKICHLFPKKKKVHVSRSSWRETTPVLWTTIWPAKAKFTKVQAYHKSRDDEKKSIDLITNCGSSVYLVRASLWRQTARNKRKLWLEGRQKRGVRFIRLLLVEWTSREKRHATEDCMALKKMNIYKRRKENREENKEGREKKT